MSFRVCCQIELYLLLLNFSEKSNDFLPIHSRRVHSPGDQIPEFVIGNFQDFFETSELLGVQLPGVAFEKALEHDVYFQHPAPALPADALPFSRPLVQF